MSDEDRLMTKLVQDACANAWDAGWEAGNDYAIAEPWDQATAKRSNPYRVER